MKTRVGRCPQPKQSQDEGSYWDRDRFRLEGSQGVDLILPTRQKLSVQAFAPNQFESLLVRLNSSSDGKPFPQAH